MSIRQHRTKTALRALLSACLHIIKRVQQNKPCRNNRQSQSRKYSKKTNQAERLAAMRPELVRERSNKNLPLTPDKITYCSNKIVYWKADCCCEWQPSKNDPIVLY